MYYKKAWEIVNSFNKIPDFSYYGDLPLGETWGLTLSQNRDSEALYRSNFEVISKDMLERFPDHVEIVNFNHYLCGWIEHVAIKFFEKPEHAKYPNHLESPTFITMKHLHYELWLKQNDLITPAGQAIFKWSDKLDKYPVADETHYCKLEHNEEMESLENCLSYEYTNFNIPSLTKSEFIDLIIQGYWDLGKDEYWLDTDEVESILESQKYIEVESVWVLNPELYDESGTLLNDPNQYDRKLL